MVAWTRLDSQQKLDDALRSPADIEQLGIGNMRAHLKIFLKVVSSKIMARWSIRNRLLFLNQ